MSTLRRWFVAGLLVWIPLGITLWVLNLLVTLMDESLRLLPATMQSDALFGFAERCQYCHHVPMKSFPPGRQLESAGSPMNQANAKIAEIIERGK